MRRIPVTIPQAISSHSIPGVIDHLIINFEPFRSLIPHDAVSASWKMQNDAEPTNQRHDAEDRECTRQQKKQEHFGRTLTDCNSNLLFKNTLRPATPRVNCPIWCTLSALA